VLPQLEIVAADAAYPTACAGKHRWSSGEYSKSH
jgi:hypothetical protein